MSDPTTIGPDGFTRLSADEAYDRLHGLDGHTQSATTPVEIKNAKADAWDEAVRECHNLGWMHDFARSDALGRNPYRVGGDDA